MRQDGGLEGAIFKERKGTMSDMDELVLCRRKLALLIELDRARDEAAHEPQTMLAAMLRAITRTLSADAGVLSLAGQAEPLIVDPQGVLRSLPADVWDAWLRTTSLLGDISRLEPPPQLQQAHIHHVVVGPLTMSGQRLGTLLLFSQQRPFGAEDLALLAAAASQSDSAIVQAQTWQQLTSRNRQLDAVYRVDQIRDETTDMNRLLMQVVDVLNDVLKADICMIGVLDPDSDQMMLRAMSDHRGLLARLQGHEVQMVLRQAMSQSQPGLFTPVGVFATHDICFGLAASLSVAGERLGGLVMMDSHKPFTQADLDLTQAVVCQVDSAIVHTRTFNQMQERTRQLEAIYRIDRVRDGTNDVQEILTSVSYIIADSLHTDLCLMSLINEETHQAELKNVLDRRNVLPKLDKEAIHEVLDWAARQRGIAVLADSSPLAGRNLKHVMGAPLVMGQELLGALVLARTRQAFTQAERDLLHAIISQADSAVAQARLAQHLAQRTKELEVLYRVDKIRDQVREFGMMLSAVLTELCSAIEAEMGFIMLFDQEGRQLELKASTSDDMLASSGHYELIEQAANRALATGKLYMAEHLDDWIDSLMCIPLILRDRIIGVFGAVNRHGVGGFTLQDRRLLQAITSQVDTAIFESMERRHIREMFQRYVGPNVVEQMLAMPEKDFFKSERAMLTMLFSDMRGFTSTTERIDVQILVEMLNMHLGAMTEVVISNAGTLDKFVGDEVVAIFGAPLPVPDHAYQAVCTALKMQAAHHGLIAWWKQRGYALPPIGIGINTGEVVVGNIGCEKQMDYTVIGDAVNLASRICAVAEGGQVLITEATYQMVADRVRVDRLPQVRVKGKEHPIQIYQVNDIR